MRERIKEKKGIVVSSAEKALPHRGGVLGKIVSLSTDE